VFCIDLLRHHIPIVSVDPTPILTLCLKITSSKLQTVPVGLAAHIVADIYMWGPLMAGSTMAAIPVIILYMLAQRALVQGLFAGSVRG
jgi:ABC-type glycerol-3-phosphate transport system permease component